MQSRFRHDACVHPLLHSFGVGALRLSALLLFVYVIACLLLLWKQEQLIFYRVQNDPLLKQQHRRNEIEIVGRDAQLQGWWLGKDKPLPLIIYFGGNAEDVLYSANQLSDLGFASVLAVNYRGYGASSGSPSQQALYDDALRIYDYAIEHGAEPHRIIVFGRSLGSGVATMLAARRTVAGAILVTPFDRLSAVAASHYPMFPVRLLLRHPFPSDEWAKNARAPALILAAERDTIVPPSHARVLADRWAGEKHFELLHNVGHNDVDHDSTYYPAIEQFIRTVAAPADQTP